MSPATKGVVVVVAGFFLSLALGSLFVWIPIGAELLRPVSEGGTHGWTVRQVSIPFATAAGSFVLAMFVGGLLHDRLGPRWLSTSGGVLVGLGTLVASMSESLAGDADSLPTFLILGFGLMVGAGSGLTLSSLVPPAVKWTVPRHSGLIAGVVVAGLALGPAWLNGSTLHLVQVRGVSWILFVQGIVLLVVIVGLSQLLENPFVGYVAPGTYDGAEGPLAGPLPLEGLTPRRMLGTRAFWALWTGTGILGAAVSFLTILLTLSLTRDPLEGGAVVLGFALAGCLGGVAAGALHDQFGQSALPGVFAFLGVALAASALLSASGHLTGAAYLAAASGVGSVVLVWVSTMECFGTRNAGGNFGLVLTGWALGMVLGALGAVVWAEGVGSGGSGTAREYWAFLIFIGSLTAAVGLASGVRRPASSSITADAQQRRRTGAVG